MPFFYGENFAQGNQKEEIQRISSCSFLTQIHFINELKPSLLLQIKVMKATIFFILLFLGTFCKVIAQQRALVFESAKGKQELVDTSKRLKVITAVRVFTGKITYFNQEVIVIQDDTVSIAIIQKIVRNTFGVVPARILQVKGLGLLIVADGELSGGMPIFTSTHLGVAGVIAFGIGTAIHLLSRKVYNTKRGKFKVIELSSFRQ